MSERRRRPGGRPRDAAKSERRKKNSAKLGITPENGADLPEQRHRPHESLIRNGVNQCRQLSALGSPSLRNSTTIRAIPHSKIEQLITTAAQLAQRHFGGASDK